MSPERETELGSRFPSYARYAALGGAARCGDGWFDVLSALLAEVEAVNPEAAVTEVKQKWGLLRVGVDGLGAGSFERLLRWERASGAACEVCGKPGVLRRASPHQTRCDRHRGVQVPDPQEG